MGKEQSGKARWKGISAKQRKEMMHELNLKSIKTKKENAELIARYKEIKDKWSKLSEADKILVACGLFEH